MRPNSVVIIDEHATVTGGATRVAVDEAVGLAATGVSVTYLASIGPTCDELSRSSVRVILLGQKRLVDARDNPSVLLQNLWNSAAFRAIDTLVNDLDPRTTVIHVHGFSQTLSGSPIRCALDRGFPVLFTLHDYFTCCPNGGFFDYPAKRVCQRRPLSFTCVARNCDKRNYAHKLYRVASTQARRYLGRIPSELKYFIGVSHSSVQRLRPYLPSDATFFFLRNPCSIPKTAPAAPQSHSHVAAIGRLSPEKGLEILLDAARHSGTQLLFIGDGPLRRTIEAAGPHRVTGWVSRSEVHRLLESVRCLALPSLWPETFGLSVMDAAARGIPSIVTNVCGAAELIDHGRTGWRVPPGDVDALAACLETVKDDPTIATIGQTVYTEYWRSPSSLDVHIHQLLQIYERILGSLPLRDHADTTSQFS